MARRHAQTARAVDPAPLAAGAAKAGPASGEWTALWVAGALCVALIAVVFGRILLGTFSNWDDPVNVTENPFLVPLTGAGLWRLWSGAYESLYVPLVYTSFAWDLLIGGGHAWPFKMGNVALHAGSAVWVLLILVQLGRERGLAAGTALVAGACMGAILFALHPLQAEPVAWITGRKDVLSGFLLLAAFWCYLRATGSGTVARTRRGAGLVRSRRFYAAAILLFGGALLAKPAAVALPLMLAAVELFWRQTPWREAGQRVAFFFVIAVLHGVLTFMAQSQAGSAFAPPPFLHRLLIAGDALAFYFGTIVWPADLGPLYARTPETVTASVMTLAAAAGALLLAAGALALRGAAGTAMAIFLAPLVLVLGVIPYYYMHLSTVADRYCYTALLGPALLLAAGGWRAMAGPAWMRGAAAGMWLVAAVGFATLTFFQAGFWQDSVRLWTRGTATAPASALAWTNYGGALAAAARYDEALAAYDRAIELDAGFGEAHFNRGVELLRREEPQRAEPAFVLAADAHRRAGFRDARLLNALTNLAAAAMRTGGLDRAEAALREALSMNPNFLPAISNLASLLLAKGAHEEAAQWTARGLALSPEDEFLRGLDAQLRAAASEAPHP